MSLVLNKTLKALQDLSGKVYELASFVKKMNLFLSHPIKKISQPIIKQFRP